MKPNALPVNFDNIPNELKRLNRWVLWKYLQIGDPEDAKFSKVPLTLGGKGASSTNPDTWTDFFSAREAYESGRFDGVGIVFDGTGSLTGIDIDDCLTDGVLSERAKDILANVEGYCEISPSGTGVKIFTLADCIDKYVDHKIGLEIYTKGRYFTITGHHLQGSMPDKLQDLSPYIPERTITRSGDPFDNYKPPLEEWTIDRVERELLPHLDPNGYDNWLSVGMCLHHQFEGDYEALELFDRWSSSGEKYKATDCQTKWNTFGGSGQTLRSLIYLVGQKKLKQALDNGEIVLEANTPIPNAQSYLQAEHSDEDGIKLVHYAGDFYVYTGTHYRPMEEATVRSGLYMYLSACKKMVKGNVVPFNPTQTTVSGVMDALKALTHLEQLPESRPPVWLREFVASKPPAHKLISMRNGIFHMENDMLLPHSLGFFNTHSLPYDYDPSATCPNWYKFLDDIWPDDEQSKNLLMEYIGYILSGDTKQQKYLSVIGPRRSGKGTINKIILELLGEHNVVSPQLSELCDTFSLQNWLGKPLASFSDARMSNQNANGIVGQLLRIVGGDAVTVNRKNKEALDVYLPTRIIMFSNEALQLSENSNALSGRMLMLQMRTSFYGKEDVNLFDRLKKELPGIFNAAMSANKVRLSREGERFIQPESAQATLDMASDIANPMNTFIEDSIEFDSTGTIDKDDLFVVYKRWAFKQNIHPGTALSFKKRFIASTQDHGVTSTRIRKDSSSFYVYNGVVLNERAQKYVDSIITIEDEDF